MAQRYTLVKGTISFPLREGDAYNFLIKGIYVKHNSKSLYKAHLDPFKTERNIGESPLLMLLGMDERCEILQAENRI